jgi:hypothetical protein
MHSFRPHEPCLCPLHLPASIRNKICSNGLDLYTTFALSTCRWTFHSLVPFKLQGSLYVSTPGQVVWNLAWVTVSCAPHVDDCFLSTSVNDPRGDDSLGYCYVLVLVDAGRSIAILSLCMRSKVRSRRGDERRTTYVIYAALLLKLETLVCVAGPRRSVLPLLVSIGFQTLQMFLRTYVPSSTMGGSLENREG